VFHEKFIEGKLYGGGERREKAKLMTTGQNP
jgi:hypothetical protein